MPPKESQQLPTHVTDAGRFTDDEPIFDPSADELDYARIAERFADAVVRMTPTLSFVVSINGGWGSGKSSFANLVRHYLETRSPDERPIVVGYNPWLFHGVEQLTQAFFLTLLYGVRPHLRRRRRLVRALLDLSAVAVGTASATPVNFLERLVRGERVFELDRLKTQLVDALQDAGRRILVVIDDIDRLSPREIGKLFGLIKTVGSLPWVTYLLCFDKTVVIKALSGVAGGRGNDYLEKIVQFSFDLPLPDRNRFRDLLLRKFGEVAGLTIEPQSFQRDGGRDILDRGIVAYLETLRNLYRLTNVLAFTFGLVRGRVLPEDFIVLEAIRLFEPAAFSALRNYPRYFAGMDLPDETVDWHEVGRFHEEWIGALKLDDRTEAALKGMLAFLFPKLRAGLLALEEGKGFAGLPGKLDELFADLSGRSGLCDPEVFSYVLSLPLK
jgi:predicted KAP-like P-loop ATPase